MTITRYKEGRFWALHDAAGRLVCVCVYKKGAIEVVRRLSDGAENPPQRWRARNKRKEVRP